MSAEPLAPPSGVHRPGSGEGVGVDYLGGPVRDPTENVRQLTEVANLRQDDLRSLNDRRLESELTSIRKEMHLRSFYEDKLRDAESGRINAIRQVDREEVAKTAAAANRAIETLALAANTTAETLRTSTAAGMAEINKRVSALEAAYSEGRGKQTVADPMVAQMMTKMDALITSGATNTGKGEGSKATIAYVIAGISIVLAILQAVMNMKR